MLTDQILITSGRRLAKLAIKDCEAIRKLPALYHPENAKRTGTIQHELGHCILQYLSDFPMAAITADSDLLQRLNQVADGMVICPPKEITSRMKFNQKADDLSGEEALQMGAEMVALLQHPLVRTIRNYAAAILHNLPTDRLERMTEDLGKRQTIVGNDEIRQFVETHLTLESLQRLKSEFISSLHSEQGALYDTLSKQDRPAGIPFCS